VTDAITIQNPRNRGGSTGHVLAKRSVTFTEIRNCGEASVGDAVSKLHKLLPENEWGALVSAHRSLPIWMANAICAQSNCTCTHPVKLG